VNSRFFHKIRLSEFYGKAWEVPGKASNLVAFIDRFEKMKSTVATTVIEASKFGPREAAATMSRWIHTMAELVSINNFNSAMQIHLALSSTAIEGLNLWRLIPKGDEELVMNMNQFMNEHDNYQRYREASDQIEETNPCIPYYLVVLRDLVYLEGDATFLEDGISLDFIKMTCLSTIYERIQEFRSVLYAFEQDTTVQTFLLGLPIAL